MLAMRSHFLGPPCAKGRIVLSSGDHISDKCGLAKALPPRYPIFLGSSAHQVLLQAQARLCPDLPQNSMYCALTIPHMRQQATWHSSFITLASSACCDATDSSLLTCCCVTSESTNARQH
eukprot:5272835-Amphidinium_carterae.1